MKKVIERIVESTGAPGENDLWLNGNELKRFKNGAWKAISGGNPGGGDSDSDIQIVELTYDHLPATGTLSPSDLEKLDGDNCLLIINGKYFYKTFSANIGFDYHEIGLATILGGLRSIYFTASKPDGEYTIAYTYPIEANTKKTQATTSLENIRVGNTTYSVPLAPMIISGSLEATGSGGDTLMFSPIVGSPTWNEAAEHMRHGGLLYLTISFNGNPMGMVLMASVDHDTIAASMNGAVIIWSSDNA